MIEMVYLNPNISKSDADKLVAEHNVRRGKIRSKALELLNGCKTEKQRSDAMHSICTALMLVG